MSIPASDSTISKIRGLLKKAEGLIRLGDENSQREADALNEKAAELIGKYGVNQALLAAQGKVEDPIVARFVAIPEGYAVDLRSLIYNITVALGGQMVYLKRRKSGTVQSYTYTAHIFAHQSTFDRIVFLFDLLQNQMLVGAASAQVPSWENARSFRKSWMSGFTAAIRDRLDRNEEKAVVERDKLAIEADSENPTVNDLGLCNGMSMALVVVDRSRAVEDKFATAYPKGTVSRSYRRLAGSGRTQGYSAGRRANIGNAVGGGRTAIAH